MSNAPKWFAESLRISVFNSTTSSPSESLIGQWWRQIADRKPDEITTQKLGILTAKGEFQNGTLVLNAQPGRIDWWLLPVLKLDEVSLTPIPVLNYYHDALKLFADSLRPWFKRQLPFRRFAVGSVAALPVASKQEAYKILGRKVRIRLDPNSGDFFYQINRPRISSQYKIKINRVSKWSASELSAQVSTPGDDAVSTRQIAIACRIELDINSDPKVTIAKKNWSLFNTLIEWSDEIIVKGDIK